MGGGAVSTLRWYHTVNGYGDDWWTLADADADSDWVRDRGLVELRLHADGWVAYANLGATGPETQPEVVRTEALRTLKQRLRALLTRLETEEVVP